MMPYGPSHSRETRSDLTERCSLGQSPLLMNQILREAARNRELPQSIVKHAFTHDASFVTGENAPEMARNFSMMLSLFREALVVLEQRMSNSCVSEDLHALQRRIEDEVVALPSRVSEVRDPIAILRALHKVPEVRVAPEFVSAVLGIRDEGIGGDVGRYSREQLMSEYAQGGFMYQPSEIVDIWPLFEYLSFAPGSVFYDLGSGYGHAVFYGAALRPDLTFKGIELMTARVEESRSVASRLGMRNVEFRAGDLSKGGFRDADIIFLFNPFPPDTMVEVQRHIAQLAEEKPLAVLDYRGLATEGVSALRQVPLLKVAPYQFMVSRRYLKESRELIGI